MIRRQTKSIVKLLSLMYREHLDKFFWQKYRPKKKPWMRYREIELVEELLTNLQPMCCLEWGTGYSTLFFPSKLSHQASWISIDHDKKWTKTIRDLQPSSIVKIHHVPANEFPWTDEIKDGAYADLTDYIEYPVQFSPYDFILVDGRARNHCIYKAYDLLQPKGIVMLHDANRKEYRASFGLYPNQLLLTCYRPKGGGIWLGSKDLPIEEVLNVAQHQAIWRMCRVVGNVFRC